MVVHDAFCEDQGDSYVKLPLQSSEHEISSLTSKSHSQYTIFPKASPAWLSTSLKTGCIAYTLHMLRCFLNMLSPEVNASGCLYPEFKLQENPIT